MYFLDELVQFGQEREAFATILVDDANQSLISGSNVLVLGIIQGRIKRNKAPRAFCQAPLFVPAHGGEKARPIPNENLHVALILVLAVLFPGLLPFHLVLFPGHLVVVLVGFHHFLAQFE